MLILRRTHMLMHEDRDKGNEPTGMRDKLLARGRWLGVGERSAAWILAAYVVAIILLMFSAIGMWATFQFFYGAVRL